MRLEDKKGQINKIMKIIESSIEGKKVINRMDENIGIQTFCKEFFHIIYDYDFPVAEPSCSNQPWYDYRTSDGKIFFSNLF